jgi:hypothetical protein
MRPAASDTNYDEGGTVRLTISGIAFLAAMVLIPVPSADAQGGGYGPWPYGGTGQGGYGPPPFGFQGAPYGPLGPTQGQSGFLPAMGQQFPNIQVCTDSQGNQVLVPNGGATSSYTSCFTPGSSSTPPTDIAQICTDSLGNRVLVLGSNTTTGYTNCGSGSQFAGPGGPGGPPGPAWFGGPGGPGGPLQNIQVCTDSLGNQVLVPNGSATSSYTGCTTPNTSTPPRNIGQVCTDSLGNRVLVVSGSSTSGYTNCGAPPAPPGPGGPGGPGAPRPGPGGQRGFLNYPAR